MHRTERGSLVCMLPTSQDTVSHLAHEDARRLGAMKEINWRWKLMITGGAGSLREYTRNWEGSKILGDARGQKLNVSRSINR